MRERLTLAFVTLALVLLVGAGLIRSYALEGQLRTQESELVTVQAGAVATVLAEELGEGDPVDATTLEAFLGDGVRIAYEPVAGEPVVVTAPGFVDQGSVSATAFVGTDRVTVSREHERQIDSLWSGDPWGVVALLALLGIIAGAVGYVVARALSAPFRQLAVAAASLGRGRFDLDLPRTRIPEARAISSALEVSAAQLRERLERERQFGLTASHVLRTPLTSLRFGLEELLADPTLTPDTRRIAHEALAGVGRIDEVAGELVEISARGVLVAAAAIPLSDLAAQIAQRWSDRLDEDDRRLSAAVEGELEALFTPGPVEQALDLVLEDVVGRGEHGVRLVFDGSAQGLRVDVTCGPHEGRDPVPADPVTERSAAVVAALGGRVEQSADALVVHVHLPRR